MPNPLLPPAPDGGNNNPDSADEFQDAVPMFPGPPPGAGGQGRNNEGAPPDGALNIGPGGIDLAGIAGK